MVSATVPSGRPQTGGSGRGRDRRRRYRERTHPDHRLRASIDHGGDGRRNIGLSILTAALLVDVVEVTTAAALGSAGLEHIEIRRIAAAVWGEL
jgi:hypothetical protein